MSAAVLVLLKAQFWIGVNLLEEIEKPAFIRVDQTGHLRRQCRAIVGTARL